MQICDPLTARQWYKHRKLVNFGLSVGYFALFWVILWYFVGPIPAACVAVVIAYFIHRFALRNRKFAVRCPHCKGVIEANTPWICGTCYWKNIHTDAYPFTHRCEHYDCRAEPKAYQCHHCGGVFFLTHDQQIVGFSISVNHFVSKAPEDGDDHEQAVLKKKHEIELKELAIKEAALEAQLKTLNQSLEMPKKKTIEDHYKGMVKNDDDARKLRAAIDEEFKNDPNERKKRHQYVDDILRETL